MRRVGCHLLLPLLALAACQTLILVSDPIQVRVGKIEREDLEAALGALTRNVRQRSEWLHASFLEAGCAQEYLELLDGVRGYSVLCALPGKEPWQIIVTANVDRASSGNGIVDNGTGMVLLPLLYRALRVEERRHTFVFAGFTDTMAIGGASENAGALRGARRYLWKLGPGGRRWIRAVVQLKALGLRSTAVWKERADPNLHQDLFSVSRALDLPLRYMGFVGYVAVDANQFRRYFIPTVTIHSFDRRTARLLEQPYRDRDTDAIDWDLYRDTARMVATYLAYIDETIQVRLDSQPETARPKPPDRPL